MEERLDCIEFETEDGEKVSLFVLEQTMLSGVNYLLATDSEEDEADAYIMREVTGNEDESVYELVEDDAELEALSKIFSELLDDVELEI
ncbi:MAG: DUF1292 domain-containing protein [Lachnospiraceae bacterium]|nr:DUF1292 domain-containing protein [Lachnospiraceae bacterium]RKI31307.1 DUF1292 domain-containing protein [bacterium D16-36]RKI73505.1 DUF1292 domain-containing protein [bacterium 1xD8-6]